MWNRYCINSSGQSVLPNFVLTVVGRAPPSPSLLSIFADHFRHQELTGIQICSPSLELRCNVLGSSRIGQYIAGEISFAKVTVKGQMALETMSEISILEWFERVYLVLRRQRTVEFI